MLAPGDPGRSRIERGALGRTLDVFEGAELGRGVWKLGRWPEFWLLIYGARGGEGAGKTLKCDYECGFGHHGV